ncbi:putative hydrolase of the HAD superfamily [Methanolobus vulcani]|uniref:Putative hydrolase of the HAD superfamily n=1 Tax=Methanolobus vulcani TaxID=38026 RepID=A0A7Z7FDM0_9EURY|nr:HAD family hydrolase [Methanolobus vulcani]MDK2824887.1 putative hydrolase of the superfamily [Methanolobus sp.]MDK2948492.1 putative hydrolase of the superfamily [Methanolobus sp.]SDF51466.1 putative hydrolase of the HAD superfamily [Methanolobus vulcani]
MSESLQVKGMIFDCYHTLIDISTDESSFYTYDSLSKWLKYHGVVIDASQLMDEYKSRAVSMAVSTAETYPEIKVEDVFESICRDFSIWDIDAVELGVASSLLFRSASLRKLEAYPQSMRLLEKYQDLPKCIVSNGQRVFSEPELRFLGFYQYFDHIIFSSDLGYKKPDKRLFEEALDLLGLEASEVISIGDTPENDIDPPQELGMQTMHIYDAWEKMLSEESMFEENEYGND